MFKILFTTRKQFVKSEKSGEIIHKNRFFFLIIFLRKSLYFIIYFVKNKYKGTFFLLKIYKYRNYPTYSVNIIFDECISTFELLNLNTKKQSEEVGWQHRIQSFWEGNGKQL